MKREQKVNLLVSVGFSKPELQRQSNEVLHSTYEAAKPLLHANAEAVRKSKEEAQQRQRARQLHNDRMAKKRAHDDAQRRLEIEWQRNWKPAPPICTVKPPLDVAQISSMIEYGKTKAKEAAQKFRETGERHYADVARQANEMWQSLMGELQGVLS